MSKAHVIYKAVRVHVVRLHASSICCGMLLPQCLEKYKCQMQIFTEPLEGAELKRDDYISCNLVRSLRCKFFADARIEKNPRV